ncbi:hypothetical protein IAR55_004105 [Kwoniella newhampshirensis]|uniref:A to I editase domain-containing protein n=1 Tax=Kwoniella newhampshirensis TaxID=1651941 RepID=A0AAW0YY23_9TREE
MDAPLSETVASSSMSLYESLPAHGKPTIRNNGVSEWTTLATISLVIPPSSESSSSSSSSSSSPTERLLPISLGTGVKVLPFSRLPPLGDALHDCHAEIIARRGFVRWLIHQASLLTSPPSSSAGEDRLYLQRKNGKFALKEGIKIWMYVSMLFCGDASTLHTAAHQSPDEAAQWNDKDISVPRCLPPSQPSTPSTETALIDTNSIGEATFAGPGVARGRHGYNNFSTLRTKPGRPDSIPSISMSCSDKIASWSVLGLQGGLLDELFEPVWLDGLVVGGVEFPRGWEGSKEEWAVMVRREVDRALWGRLIAIQDHLPPPYTLHKPRIHFTSTRFPHSKSYVLSSLPSSSTTPEPAPSPLSLSHLPFLTASAPTSNPNSKSKALKMEIIANGTLLHHVWKPPGEILMKEKGRSRICKFEILRVYEDLCDRLKNRVVEDEIDVANESENRSDNRATTTTTYHDHKHRSGSKYQIAKRILRGSPRPISGLGSGSFGSLQRYGQVWSTDMDRNQDQSQEIDDGDAPQVEARVDGRGSAREEESMRSSPQGVKQRLPIPPFKGWLVSGKAYESFTLSGTLRRESDD